MKKSLYAREATHAGTWYDSDPKKLGADLDGYIDSAKVEKNSAKVVVTPHAGYIYCGPTSGHSFRALDKGEGVNKVFVIGPSHFVDFKGCAVTMYDAVVTPFGEIPVDKALRNELLATHKFALMGELGDLNEHSLEMEYPILKRAFGEKPFTVVPVFVSLADMKAIEMYGRIFAKYLADPSCVFVVSSDFCHWGKRYEYTYINKEWMGEGTISDSIRELDHLGARLIVDRDPKKFLDYIDEYKSPVCGNIAIAIMLAAMNASGDPYKGEFVHYSQSDVVRTMDDFAVGYCSITFGWDKKKASEWSCLDVYNWASSVDRIQAAAFILRECNTDGKKLEVMTEVSLTQSPFNFTPELSKAILDEYKGAKNIFNVMSFDLDDVLGDLTDFVTANDTSSTSTTTTATTSAAAAAKPLGTSARSRAKSPNFFYLQPNAGGKHITYLSTLSSVQHASLTCGTGSSIYKKTTPTGHSQRYSTPPATAAATAHATQTPTATATAKTTVSEPKATPITTTNAATTTNTAIDTNTTVVKLTPTPVATTATATTTITAEPVPTPAVATITATATATPVVLPTVQTVSTQPVDNAATATVVSVELKPAAQVTPPTQVQATPVTPALTDLSTAMATAAAEAAPQLITTETAETAPQESAAATTAITATDLKPEATPVVLPAADSPVIAVELTPATPVVVTADAQLQFVSSNAELTPITSSEPVPVTPTTTSTSSTTIPEAAVDVTANMPSIMPEVATVATPEPISITTTTTTSSLSSLSLSTPAIATTPATTVTAEQVPTSTTTATIVTVEPTAVISAAATTATTTTTMMPTCPEAERPPVVVTHSQNHETSSPAMSSQPVTPQPIILTTTTEHNKASSSSNNGSPSPTDKEKDKEKEKEREKRGKSKFFFGSSSLLDKGSSSNTDSPESKKRHLITRILRPRSSSPGEISSDSSSSSNSSSSSSNSNSGPSNPGQPRPPENAELRGDPEALKAAICEMDRRSNSGTEFKDYWSSRPLPWDAWAPAATPSEAASSTSLIALDCTRAKYVVELCGAAGVQRAVPDIGLSIVAGEEEADFYGTFIAPHPHETYVFPSIPAVVSLLAPGKQVGPWCKAIVRTPEADKRVMVLFEKKTIRAVMPDMWQRGTLEKSALLENGLARYEAVHKPSPHFKFGVIYVKADQTDENAMFGNKHTEASEDYKDFLRFLGQEITLRGWSKYCGGLDASADATGTVSVYTEFKGHEIMFHVGTLLPDQEHDPQKVEKKRHIGNDVVVIIFKEQSSPEDRFDPRILTSHFNHCFFVFSVAKRDDKGAATHYRMTVGFKPGVPPTQPYLPESNVYEKNSTSRELFLTKMLNCERAALYNAPEFSSLTTSRKEYIESLCKSCGK